MGLNDFIFFFQTGVQKIQVFYVTMPPSSRSKPRRKQARRKPQAPLHVRNYQSTRRHNAGTSIVFRRFFKHSALTSLRFVNTMMAYHMQLLRSYQFNKKYVDNYVGITHA